MIKEKQNVKLNKNKTKQKKWNEPCLPQQDKKKIKLKFIKKYGEKE